MIGAIRMVWAMTIACGVNRMPHEPSGPERDSKKDRQPHDHRRQAHQRIEDHDHRLAAGEARERKPGAERQPDEAASTTADRLTISDSRTIANSAGSPASTSCRAERSPA